MWRQDLDLTKLSKNPLKLSVAFAIILPTTTNERNTVENVSIQAYNPHAFITLRKINPESNDSMFIMHKANELEDTLNRINILEKVLDTNQKLINQIIDNLSAEGWYSDSVDKEDVLRDLCSILGHDPQQEMSWSATITISGTSLVDLDEVNDFDIRYHLNDELSIDSNDFNTKVDSWDIYDVDSQDWN